MRINLKHSVLVTVMALGVGITGGMALIAATPQEQQQQDYSKNKNYQQGMRDGHDDAVHDKDHSKKRHFKKDDDQKAYEAGYQQSHHK